MLGGKKKFFSPPLKTQTPNKEKRWGKKNACSILFFKLKPPYFPQNQHPKLKGQKKSLNVKAVINMNNHP